MRSPALTFLTTLLAVLSFVSLAGTSGYGSEVCVGAMGEVVCVPPYDMAPSPPPPPGVPGLPV